MATAGTWQELFGGGRKWRVAEEVTGEQRCDGVRGGKTVHGLVARFERGHFELPSGTAFRSPLSTNLGRRGVLLQETDATGEHDIPRSRISVGEAAVARARKDFSAVW